MRINDLLDEIEQLEKNPPDRYVMLNWMNAALRELIGVVDSDVFQRQLTPAITTVDDNRGPYALPEDFPENFVKYAGQRHYRALNLGNEKWVCKISDGSNENLLDYEPLSIFHSRNLEGESSGKPVVYTLETDSLGRRTLWLSPPPDGTYYINGLYFPEWKLNELDQLPPVPLYNVDVLKYAVLKRINPQRWEQDYVNALNALMLKSARNRTAQFYPALGRGGYNSYANTLRRV